MVSGYFSRPRLRPVDNGSRMPADRSLYYDPYDGQPTVITHNRTYTARRRTFRLEVCAGMGVTR